MIREECIAGARVRAINEYEAASLTGKCGTIVITDNGRGNVGVRFDEKVLRNGREVGHGLDGKCQHGYGWYMPLSCLELESKVTGMKDFVEAMGDKILAGSKPRVLETSRIEAGAVPASGSFTSSMTDFAEITPTIVIREGRSLTAVGTRVGAIVYL